MYLLLFGIFVVCLGLFYLFRDYFKYQASNGDSAFDVAHDVIDEDTKIVLANNAILSKYYFKRGVLRFSKHLYYASDVYSCCISLYLALISLSRDSSSLFQKIFRSIDFINKSSLIMIVVSCFIRVKGDAYIGIVISFFVLIYQYFFLQICSSCIDKCSSIKLKNKKKVMDVFSHFYRANMLFFISTLIFLLRFVVMVIY